MCEQPVITVDNVAKSYPLYASKKARLLEALDPFRRSRHSDFFALSDISFSVARGESIGIMGVNGSGKSTLLKILTGVLTPSSGSVAVNGRVAALLELGAGFHPERTGLDNLYFQGALQGLERNQIDAQLADIVKFADIGDFLYQPVKLYSSGMFVRLAFAAAVQGAPDIFIVDEALAVGDARFQRKCFQRIEQLKERGTTFLFVSHDTSQVVSHCTRALLLSGGRLIMDDTPRKVTNRYWDLLFGNKGEDSCAETAQAETESTPASFSVEEPAPQLDAALAYFMRQEGVADRFCEHPWYNPYEYRWGNKKAEILDVCVSSSGNTDHVVSGDVVSICIKVLFHEAVQLPGFGLTVKTKEGICVYGTNSLKKNDGKILRPVAAGTVLFIKYTLQCDIAPGEYFISCGVADMISATDVPLDRRFDSLLLKVHGTTDFWGMGDMNASIVRLAAPGQLCAKADVPALDLGDRRLLVVLGMHRSGTSVLTHGMSVFGVQFGDTLMEATKENPTGYWEDLDIVAFNDAVLEFLEKGWSSVSCISPLECERLRDGGYVDKAAALLREKMALSAFHGIKDPRMSRLLPFWAEVFQQLGIKPFYVIVFRNPLSVVRSLEKRDAMPRLQAYCLWFSHVLECVRFGARNERTAFVNYDEFIENPQCVLDEIGKKLDLPVDEQQMASYLRVSVNKDLRHTRYGLPDLQADPACPDFVRELFARLLAGDTAESTLAAYDSAFAGFAAVTDCIDGMVRQQADKDKQLRACHDELERLRALQPL